MSDEQKPETLGYIQGSTNCTGDFAYRLYGGPYGGYGATFVRGPSGLVTAEGKLAVTPFPDMSIKTSLQGQGSVKVARIENKASLVELDVLFPTMGTKFCNVKKVLVRGDQFTATWAKEVYDFNGVKYILVPVDKVEAVVYP